jgi:CRP-like cAMP-binding protein
MISGLAAKDDRPAVNRLFRSLLKAEELDRYLTSYPAGTVIQQYGKPCLGVLLVRDGCARVSQPLDHGRTKTLCVVRTGGAVGLTSCLSDVPCRYTAQAETPVNGYFVPAELIHERLREHPEAYASIVQLLSSSLQAAYAHLRESRSQKPPRTHETEPVRGN